MYIYIYIYIYLYILSNSRLRARLETEGSRTAWSHARRGQKTYECINLARNFVF